MSDSDTTSPFLPLPDGIFISAVRTATTELVVHIACRLPCATCPLCQQPSERVHGTYGRMVSDLPCGGRRVILALAVRKFVCGTSTCPRQIFTERLPELVQSYARMTNRLREALVALGLATSAEVSERLAPQLSMLISAPTLLRCLRTVACPPPTSVRILGVDDWTWKKGQTYGTILVDLEKRCTIDLLPDRKEETLTAWLLTHPEIDVISRDRGGEYAVAGRKGAPQAQQIADRFHLLKNLRERLKELMDRKHFCLPEVEERSSDAIKASAQGSADTGISSKSDPQTDPEPEKHYRSIPPSPYQRPPGMSYNEFQKQVRRDKRVASYEHVRMLFDQGLSQRTIARKLKLSRKTVSTFVQAEAYPERHASKAGASRSLLDPYKGYLLQR